MIGRSKGGWVTDFENMGVFPLVVLDVVARIIDTIGGCGILGECGGLFKREGLSLTPNDEET